MNFKDNNPIYLQIAERICDEILQGRYSEDDRIPSVREYAAMVEVNANTVVRTFDHLQSLEVIYNKRGLGYFVAKGAVRRITKERKRTFLTEELPELFRKMDTLKISFAPLWQTEEYKDIALLERVKLCDTVTVIYEALGVSVKAKVIAYEYDALKEKYTKIKENKR